jgi:hypothetical protein
VSVARLGTGLVLAATLALGGCAMTVDATDVGVPVQLSTAAGEPPVGRDFEVTTRALYGVWGLLKLREPDIGTALAGQLVGGERIANVRVRVRSRWSDVLISGLTLGLIVPRAVTYEGTVVGP